MKQQTEKKLQANLKAINNNLVMIQKKNQRIFQA